MTARSPSPLSALGQRTQAPPISWLMDLTLSRPELISLAAGFTDNATLPVGEARSLFRGLLGRRATGEPALQYGSTAGLPELRRLTGERLKALDLAPDEGHVHEPLYAPENLVISHGSQQLLYLITEVLCDPGDIVIVEDPTYFVFLGILQSHGLRCRGVHLEADGLDIRQLDTLLARLKRERQLHRLKLLYLVTYHQNPTSTTTAFAKKAAALDLLRFYERAAGHPIYLLEDAAYRELQFRGPDEASALAVAGGPERVLYAGTYSKPFATGVRVGFGVLPEPVRTAVMRVKGNHDFGTTNLSQHLLAAALAEGVYDRQVRRLRKRYATKAGWMTAALRADFPADVRWQEPGGGMYVWARLPRGVRTGAKSEVFGRALDAGVLYVPGRLCYADDATRRAPDNEMRLSFGNASEAQIREGIARLSRAVRAAL